MSLTSILQPGNLSPKPWTGSAIIRLFAGVVVCMFLGGLSAQTIRFFTEAHKHSPMVLLVATGASAACFCGALFVLSREWKLEKFFNNLIALLACVYAGFFLMWMAAHQLGNQPEIHNTTIETLVTVLSFQGAALVLTHFFVREHRMSWSQAFGFENNLLHTVLLGFAAALVAVPCAWAMQALTATLLDQLHVQPQEQEAVRLLRGVELLTDRMVLGFATVVIAPLAEEVLFRGILYPAIKARGYPRLALWGTAAFFALIHLNVATFLPLMFLAVALTWLYEKTNNLLAGVITHSLFNAVNFLALYFVAQ